MTADARDDVVHSKAIPDLIAKMLTERQEILVLLARLGELRPYQNNQQARSVLQQFCQVLVDYVALGHFEVYQCLDSKPAHTEQCRDIKRLAQDLYPRIAATTEAAIAFNDRYDAAAGQGRNLDALCEDLSHLGEKLAERIELEDRLIAVMGMPEPVALASN